MRNLDETLGVQKERAAAELLSSFEQMSLSGSTPNLMAERERIEDHFRRIREEKLKGMMDKISTEEKTRTAKMLDRHGYEMMLLISEKVTPLICVDLKNCFHSKHWNILGIHKNVLRNVLIKRNYFVVNQGR